ncbi:MAG: hypothetical protein WA919_26035 [Coleofasciculaceae cyanobacterium]
MSKKQEQNNKPDPQKELLRQAALERYLSLKGKPLTSLSLEERYFLENYQLYLKELQQV